ncbi:phosphatase PAP2 family protein [Chitinophaga filiformis]|uniref:Membrane-associated phospholipid phosphatase n=1 Tax=Chitinophaga filiformis TaxID=104663 RepID=A0A1G8C8G8_CHIFI|nr:phosphatase PAP2 family protein [Chitinophaga filiformis]SDH41688.1 Membrane-associated phospholipid phosphatase [Chitinophaga filiformis]
MNVKVINNYSKLKPCLFSLPISLLAAITLFLYHKDSLHTDKYVQIQKDIFFFINYNLGQFPDIVYNLTQLGDASIILSVLSIFILYAPRMWESLISASLASFVFSVGLKNIFRVPRPAVVFDNNCFVIIGKKAVGYASLPSGHSITVFTTFTVLLFAFMPERLSYKILWVLSIIITGLIIAFTRVGVGAHYPLDVIIGSIIGYISGLAGIFISRKYRIWAWVNNKKYYPVFILSIVACFVSLISQIIDKNLIILYFVLICPIVPFYKMAYAFIKR